MTALPKDGDRYVVESGERRFEADRVVVATGFYGKPSVPEFASELDPRIVQMHSSEYRDPSQLRPAAFSSSAPATPAPTSRWRCRGRTGPGSPAETRARSRFRIEHPLRRLVVPVLWFVASHVLTVKTPIGRKVRPHVLEGGARGSG